MARQTIIAAERVLQNRDGSHTTIANGAQTLLIGKGQEVPPEIEHLFEQDGTLKTDEAKEAAIAANKEETSGENKGGVRFIVPKRKR